MVFEVVFFFLRKILYISVSLWIFTHIAKMLRVTTFSMERAVALTFPVKHGIFVTKKTNKINPAFCRILPSIFMIMGYLRIPFENRIYKTTFIYVVCVTSFILVVTVILSFAVILFVAVNNI